MGITYKCAACGETLESEWTETEAKAESKLLWGDLPEESMCVICDDCFQKGKESALAEYHADQKPN